MVILRRQSSRVVTPRAEQFFLRQVNLNPIHCIHNFPVLFPVVDTEVEFSGVIEVCLRHSNLALLAAEVRGERSDLVRWVIVWHHLHRVVVSVT